MISAEHFLQSHAPTGQAVSITDDNDTCREAALRLLDYADRSTGDMRTRLATKGYQDTVIEQVIARLVELGYLDDSRYAHLVIRSCVARGLGERACRMELLRKGIPSPVVSECLQEARMRGSFVEAAWQLGRSYLRRTQGLDQAVQKRRFFAAASRKGHELTTIYEVYDTLFHDEHDEGDVCS